MHETPAPFPDKSSPRVMASRLSGYLKGVATYADGYLEHDSETPRPTDKPRHMQHRYHQRLLTHIRRAEYQLRCFILWLAAILIEKAQANPQRLNALTATTQVTTRAQAVEPQARNEAEQNNNFQPTGLAWQQELELRRLTAKTPPIGGFTVTTPDFTGASRRARRRVRKFLPDPLKPVDASCLLARMARLPRILARADQMAERLARRAALSAFYRESRAEAENNKNSALSQFYRESRAEAESNKNSALSAFYREGKAVAENTPLPGERGRGAGMKTQLPPPSHPRPFSSKRGDRLLSVSVSQARDGPPNPLWFKPFRHWLPPEELWASSDDEDERADLNWLHHVAVGALTRTGFAPGNDPANHLPDFARFEPPALPQVRST